jgi:hypothetical protein
MQNALNAHSTRQGMRPFDRPGGERFERTCGVASPGPVTREKLGVEP